MKDPRIAPGLGRLENTRKDLFKSFVVKRFPGMGPSVADLIGVVHEKGGQAWLDGGKGRVISSNRNNDDIFLIATGKCNHKLV